MRLSKPKQWLLVVVIGVVSVLAMLLWQLLTDAQPQIVTLPNGSSYRFAGATYGTNHVVGSPVAKALAKLPPRLAGIARRMLGNRLDRLDTYATPKPMLCIWLKPVTIYPGRFPTTTYAMLAGESGALSGDRPNFLRPGFSTTQRLHLDFNVLPRRSRMLQCVFFEQLPGSPLLRDYRQFARVNFVNPLSGKFDQWQPEPLPATKTAGDVQVRLNRFTTGHSPIFPPGSYDVDRNVGEAGRPMGFLVAKPGEDVHAAFDVTFLSQGRRDRSWTIHSAELTDATGNQMRDTEPRGLIGQHGAIAPALWPDEAAWRLNLEIKRTEGFSPEELVKFAGVRIPPPGQTNWPSITQKSGAVQITLKQFARRPDTEDKSWWGGFETYTYLEHTKIPSGIVLSLLQITANDGRKLYVARSSWTDQNYHFNLSSIPTNVETVDITFAVQQTRTVEFLVKPVVAAQEPGR